MTLVREATELLVDGEPTSDLRDFVELWMRRDVTGFGHTDFRSPSEEWPTAWCDPQRYRYGLFLVEQDESVVAGCHYKLPLLENQRGAGLRFAIDPDLEPAPILDMLWQAVTPVLDKHKRDIVWTWSAATFPNPEHKVLHPATGFGELRSGRFTSWLLDKGFRLEQVKVASTLNLDNPSDVLKIEPNASKALERYELLSWVGAAPAELIEAVAMQRHAMSIDAPIGALQFDEETWDATRVRHEEEVVEEIGERRIWTVARMRSGPNAGQVVAHTFVGCYPGQRKAHQHQTFVRREHRGQHLGLLVKLANMAQLRKEFPEVCRVWTTSAYENSYMHNINDSIGFERGSIIGNWQLERELIT